MHTSTFKYYIIVLAMNKLYLFCLRQHACDFKNLKVRPRGQEREIFLSEVESLVLIMVDYKEGDKNAKN